MSHLQELKIQALQLVSITSINTTHYMLHTLTVSGMILLLHCVQNGLQAHIEVDLAFFFMRILSCI